MPVSRSSGWRKGSPDGASRALSHGAWLENASNLSGKPPYLMETSIWSRPVTLNPGGV